jgi:RNA polymerase sigma-70 factor (ECF subfamily)
MIKVLPAGEMNSMEATTTLAPSLGAADRFGSLYREHADFVWRTARRFGLSAAEADDATQQVFLLASRKLSSIPVDGEKPFLFASAVNVARTMIRSRLRKREEPPAETDMVDPQPDPERRLQSQRACEIVNRILASMPEDVRMAFVLFELEEMTALEVAKFLDVPPGTVASRVRRAREIFRAAAKEEGAP